MRDGAVFIGTDGSVVGSLWGFQLSTGELLWSFEVLDDRAQRQGVPTAIVGPPSTVCGITFGDEVFCLDAKNGTTRWKFRSGHDWNPGTLRPSPALVKQRLLFPALDGTVYCLDAANGTLLWKRKLPAAISTTIVADDKSAYVGSDDGRLYRLGTRDGRIQGTIDLGSRPYFTPLLHESALYLFSGSDQNNRLIAVDRDLTTILWQQTTPGGWSSPRPYVYGDHVIAGTENGDLVALDAKTGRKNWSEHLGGVIRAIGTDGEVMYVGSLSGRVTAIRRKPRD